MTKTADTVTKIHLEGMSDAGVPELASLARSWENPARLTIETAGFSGGEYDPSERAWIIERTAAKSLPRLRPRRQSGLTGGKSRDYREGLGRGRRQP